MSVPSPTCRLPSLYFELAFSPPLTLQVHVSRRRMRESEAVGTRVPGPRYDEGGGSASEYAHVCRRALHREGGRGAISADNSLVARALESRYNALIDACGKARQLTRAFDVLSMMKGGGVRPDAVSFTCLIDAVGHSLDQNGSMVALQKVFEMMREAGQSCTVGSFTAAIKICLRANCFEQAFLLFDEMTRRGYAFADPATHALVAEYSARERGRGAISSPAARFLVP